MCDSLTNQVRTIAAVTTAVANGNLSQKVEIEAEGEIAQLKDTINNMVAQLSTFASEVTRVTREVGTMGQLGGQVQVEGVSGEWRHLTNNVSIKRWRPNVEVCSPSPVRQVNKMCNSLTNQVRSIAAVTTAVANGNLSQKVDIDAEGEIAELKETINSMVDQLSIFASEVTRVTLEVGSQGLLGGRVQVQGVSGEWKRLTDNVSGFIIVSRRRDSHSQYRSTACATVSPIKFGLSRLSPLPLQTATCHRRLRSKRRARSLNSKTPSTTWSPSSACSPARSHVSHERSERWVSLAAKFRSRASVASGNVLPTTYALSEHVA